MKRSFRFLALNGVVLFASLGALCPMSAGAQEAIVTQTLPPIAPAPETPFARALVRLDDLEAQIRSLTNRLERAESELANQKNDNTRLAKLLDEAKAVNIVGASNPSPSEVSATENLAEPVKTEPSKPPPEIASNESAVNTGSGVPSSIPAAANTIVPNAAPQINKPAPIPTPATAKAAMAPPPTAIVKPAPILLSEAKLMLQRSEFASAETHLKLLTESYPDAGETPEGLWLLGETRFVQKAYNSAALAYVAYLGKAPNGPRVSDSLLRLSSSFREIGDNRQRCLAFKEYQKRTPNPTPLQTARANAELAKGPCS